MRYATKADWAAAKAENLRADARALPYVPSADWRRVRGRMRARQTLLADADRFDRMARAFRRRGE